MMHDKLNFTHIVVGAGSGGCIVAARIAENINFDVLLLEAGYDCSTSSSPLGVLDIRRVPMKGQSEIFDASIDWDVRVELPDGASMNVAQAKLVGGGSSINGGTALRNAVEDSKEWVDLGNDHWNWESVEPVYAALEGDEVRGTKGPHPLTRTTLGEAGKIQTAFVAASNDHGLPWIEDLNVQYAEGSGASPVCRQGTRRVSVANTFIDPIRDRSNFTLLTEAHVDRVLFSNRKAVGVLLADGRKFWASNETIVCAGAIFSPALLHRSGVGPSAVLSPLSIPVIQDLPVGENLVDHACIPVVSRPRAHAYTDTDFSLQMQARWSSTHRPGALDLQLVCFSYLFSAPPPEELTPSSTNQRSLGGTETGRLAGIGCNVNKPTSSGSVRVSSCDPYMQPLVQPNYLTTACDRACAREVVRRAYTLVVSQHMQNVLHPPIGLTSDIIASDGELDDWIQSQYSSTYHFSGTCRMAGVERGGVVDQGGHVYGVHGLRVVDASVIPTIPAANTMWTTVMFAERIGRLIQDSCKNIDA